MYNRLIDFMVRNDILTEIQNGCREKRSTETAIQSFLESIKETIKKKLKPVGTFFYLTKVYDVLNHEILLSSLNSCWVRGMANSCFELYVSRLRQCVEVRHKISTNLDQGKYVSTIRGSKHGVPQSSILGPVLLLLYIDDFPINTVGFNSIVCRLHKRFVNSRKWKCLEM
jgi:hypothetical protein